MTPARGLVFVRPVKTAEAIGAIVLLESTRERWTGMQAEVVAVGEPAICEDEDCERDHPPLLYGIRYHAPHFRVGAWVLVTPRAFVEVEPGLWAVPQDHVLAVIEP